MTSNNHGKHSHIDCPTDLSASHAEMLTGDSLDLIAALCDEFAPRIRDLVARREAAEQGDAQSSLSSAELYGASDWHIPEIPGSFSAGQLELVVPPEHEALSKAVASGADYCIINIADALSPSMVNAIGAQVAIHECLGGPCADAEDRPVLVLRPRPLCTAEPGLLWRGEPVPAALVDACLYIVHNASLLEQHGSGVYLELTQLASLDDARLWRDLIRNIESGGHVTNGSVRASIRVDTVLAAFAIDGILCELRDYAVGLNVDFIAYAASFIRTFQRFPAFMLPDRAELTVVTPFLSALATHVVRSGQRRGVPTSAPAVPQLVTDDAEASARSLHLAKRDLCWYRQHGFDRLRVVDPALVKLASEVRDTVHPAPETRPDRAPITPDDLLQTARGKITRTGIRDNLRILLRYLQAVSEGRGTVAASGQLHDAGSARLALAQLWQWARHATGVLDEGRNVDSAMIRSMLDEEEDDADAGRDLLQLISANTLPDRL